MVYALFITVLFTGICLRIECSKNDKKCSIVHDPEIPIVSLTCSELITAIEWAQGLSTLSLIENGRETRLGLIITKSPYFTTNGSILCPLDINATVLLSNRITLLSLSTTAPLTLCDSSFSSLPSLLTLNLSYCGIRSLPDKIFLNLKRLEYLDMTYNSLVTLSSVIFMNCPNLVELRLDQNNELKQFVVAETSYLPSLLRLGLTSCRLTYDFLVKFKLPPKLRELYISNNNVAYLPNHVVEWLGSSDGHLKEFSIHNNPISCDCQNSKFLRTFRTWAAKRMLRGTSDYNSIKRRPLQWYSSLGQARCANPPQYLDRMVLSVADPERIISCDLFKCPARKPCGCNGSPNDIYCSYTTEDQLVPYSTNSGLLNVRTTGPDSNLSLTITAVPSQKLYFDGRPYDILKLTSLRFKSCPMNELTMFTLTSFCQNLSYFAYEYTPNLIKISEYAFKRCQGLLEISLQENAIEVIERETFSEQFLPNLRILDLSRNSIFEFVDVILPTGLGGIIMDDNPIRTLGAKAFLSLNSIIGIYWTSVTVCSCPLLSMARWSNYQADQIKANNFTGSQVRYSKDIILEQVFGPEMKWCVYKSKKSVESMDATYVVTERDALLYLPLFNISESILGPVMDEFCKGTYQELWPPDGNPGSFVRKVSTRASIGNLNVITTPTDNESWLSIISSTPWQVSTAVRKLGKSWNARNSSRTGDKNFYVGRGFSNSGLSLTAILCFVVGIVILGVIALLVVRLYVSKNRSKCPKNDLNNKIIVQPKYESTPKVAPDDKAKIVSNKEAELPEVKEYFDYQMFEESSATTPK